MWNLKILKTGEEWQSGWGCGRWSRIRRYLSYNTEFRFCQRMNLAMEYTGWGLHAMWQLIVGFYQGCRLPLFWPHTDKKSPWRERILSCANSRSCPFTHWFILTEREIPLIMIHDDNLKVNTGDLNGLK